MSLLAEGSSPPPEPSSYKIYEHIKEASIRKRINHIRNQSYNNPRSKLNANIRDPTKLHPHLNHYCRRETKELSYSYRFEFHGICLK